MGKSKKHLIFDLDGVLVDGYVIRPGLATFFEFLFHDPRVASISIWTASQGWWKDVYPFISAHLPKDHSFRFVWQGNRCKIIQDQHMQFYYYVKPLRKVWKCFKKDGIDRRNTIIFDDTHFTYRQNHGNAVLVKPFKAAEVDTDVEFLRLRDLLDRYLLPADDVRTVIARGQLNH